MFFVLNNEWPILVRIIRKNYYPYCVKNGFTEIIKVSIAPFFGIYEMSSLQEWMTKLIQGVELLNFVPIKEGINCIYLGKLEITEEFATCLINKKPLLRKWDILVYPDYKIACKLLDHSASAYILNKDILEEHSNRKYQLE